MKWQQWVSSLIIWVVRLYITLNKMCWVRRYFSSFIKHRRDRHTYSKKHIMTEAYRHRYWQWHAYKYSHTDTGRNTDTPSRHNQCNQYSRLFSILLLWTGVMDKTCVCFRTVIYSFSPHLRILAKPTASHGSLPISYLFYHLPHFKVFLLLLAKKNKIALPNNY